MILNQLCLGAPDPETRRGRTMFLLQKIEEPELESLGAQKKEVLRTKKYWEKIWAHQIWRYCYHDLCFGFLSQLADTSKEEGKNVVWMKEERW